MGDHGEQSLKTMGKQLEEDWLERRGRVFSGAERMK